MSDNNPIKDYNPASLKLDRLKEKMEMYIDRDDPITDLHDCSNDLSDAGSRKEEYEHAEFAENIRTQGKYKKNNVKNKRNILQIVFFLLYTGLIVSMLLGLPIFFLLMEQYNLIEEWGLTDVFEESYVDSEEYIYEPEMKIEDFEQYKDNISIKTLTTKEEETYVQLYNANTTSCLDLKLQTIFYNEYNQILTTVDTNVDILIGENNHFVEIIDAPTKYDRCEHNIISDYGTYSDITKRNLYLETGVSKIERENFEDAVLLPSDYKYAYAISLLKDYSEKKIFLVNYNFDIKVMNCVEVVFAYIKDDKLVQMEKYNFFDLAFGKMCEKDFELYQPEENNSIDEVIVTVNNVDI